MNPNRVVIDTNVFISALLNPLGTPKKVINIAVSQFTILQSEATYQELATRISKKKFDKYLEKDDRLDFLSSLKNRSLFVDILHETRVCSDLDFSILIKGFQLLLQQSLSPFSSVTENFLREECKKIPPSRLIEGVFMVFLEAI